MDIAFQKHWLEDAIGSERDAEALAASLAARPEFLAIIRESLEHAAKLNGDAQTRDIAEHIAYTLHKQFKGFTTSHG